LVMLWPVIVSGAFLYARRERVTRKIRFFILTVLSGYAIMFAGGFVANYICLTILTGIDGLSGVPLFLISFSPFGIAFILPVVTVYYLMQYLHRSMDK